MPEEDFATSGKYFIPRGEEIIRYQRGKNEWTHGMECISPSVRIGYWYTSFHTH